MSDEIDFAEFGLGTGAEIAEEFGLMDDITPPVKVAEVSSARAFGLRPYQAEAMDSLREGFTDEEVTRQLAVLATGCFAKNTPIMMGDGTISPVQSIGPGDLVMGVSGPSLVIKTNSGIAPLYVIRPVKGEPHIVDESHTLTLWRIAYRGQPARIIDIKVKEYMNLPRSERHLLKLFRGTLPIACETPLSVSPYFMGVFLGDGSCYRWENRRGWRFLKGVCITTADAPIIEAVQNEAARFGLLVRVEAQPGNKSSNYHITSGRRTGRGEKANALAVELDRLGVAKQSGEKFIPHAYKVASESSRARLLAGLIDTDGSKHGQGFDYISKSQRLADDCAFVARSLGLAAYVTPCEKRDQHGNGGTYYRVSISGDCSIIPVRIERKICAVRRQIKSVARTGFTLEPAGRGRYYGFTLNSLDGRFLLGDFTVSHNCGKTILFAAAAKQEVSKGGRVLILAHTDELLEQAIDKLSRSTGLKAAKEKAGAYASRSDKVVVASVQTLQRVRLTTWPKKHFTLIIVDEAHRSLAQSYQNILTYFEARVIGVTATADRGDKRALGDFYQRIAFDYGLLRAVHDGWLVRPIVKTMPVKIDLDGVKSKNTSDGADFDRMDVAQRLSPYLEAIAGTLKKEAGDRKLILFLPSVETAILMTTYMNKVGITCDYVTGDCDDRSDKIKRYKEGKTQAICNMALLTEGFDHDSIDSLVVLRPTKIRSLYAQMVGRGTRPLNSITAALAAASDAKARLDIIAKSAKPHLTIYDFLWIYKRHDLIRPASLVSSDPRVVTEMAGKDGDLLEVQKQAERDLLAKLEKEIRKNQNKKARTVDPLAIAAETHDIELADYEPETARDAGPPSPGHMKILEQNGVSTAAVKCYGHARLLVGRILARHQRGLCTVKQMHFLAKLGIDASNMSKAEATRLQQQQLTKWADRAKQEVTAKLKELNAEIAAVKPEEMTDGLKEALRVSAVALASGDIARMRDAIKGIKEARKAKEEQATLL